jgi:hypothetical protein
VLFQGGVVVLGQMTSVLEPGVDPEVEPSWRKLYETRWIGSSTSPRSRLRIASSAGIASAVVARVFSLVIECAS